MRVGGHIVVCIRIEGTKGSSNAVRAAGRHVIPKLIAGGYIKGFEIAGADKKFYFARAVMEGHRVVVSADSVKQPVAVRYAWADDAGEANLYNKEGFPAVPFRTDQWKGITEEKKYQPSR